MGGLLALGIGAAVFWFFVFQPLQAAQAGAAEVSYSLRAFVLVPFCLVYGLAFLLLGDRFQYRTPDHRNFTAAGWLALVLAAALSGGGWWWFDQQFSMLGYV